MVSIDLIARKCNVSTATVSKALNNKPDVGKQTRERILKVASEMGYVANTQAQALRTKRTHNIGILLTNTEQIFCHDFFSRVLENIKNEVQKSGYDITFINDTFANDNISIKRHCEYRSFDGVIIVIADFASKEIIELANSDIPVVTIDHVFDNCPSVSSDNITGMSELVEYAISMGHKKIAYIHGENTRVTRDRLAGFYATMHKHNLPIPKEYIKESYYRNTTLTEKRTKELLKLKNPPTCIFYPDDYSMTSSIKIINDSKHDISYVGYDGIDVAKNMSITTYEQDRDKLGILAARKLIDKIEKSDYIVEHTVVTGKVYKGNSLKKI